MTEAEIVAIVANAMAQHQPEMPTLGDTMWAKGLMKAGDAALGGIFYLLVLWIVENSKLQKLFFKYSDDVARDEQYATEAGEKAHGLEIAIQARSNLARVNAAKIHGFAVVVGLILAF